MLSIIEYLLPTAIAVFISHKQFQYKIRRQHTIQHKRKLKFCISLLKTHIKVLNLEISTLGKYLDEAAKSQYTPVSLTINSLNTHEQMTSLVESEEYYNAHIEILDQILAKEKEYVRLLVTVSSINSTSKYLHSEFDRLFSEHKIKVTAFIHRCRQFEDEIIGMINTELYKDPSLGCTRTINTLVDVYINFKNRPPEPSGKISDLAIIQNELISPMIAILQQNCPPPMSFFIAKLADLNNQLFDIRDLKSTISETVTTVKNNLSDSLVTLKESHDFFVSPLVATHYYYD